MRLPLASRAGIASSAVLAFALAFAVALGACSSGGSAPAGGADAAPGSGGRPLGEPCDPAARPPCVILTDVCSVSVCDPASRVCVRVPVDAGPTCSSVHPVPPCSSGACDGGADAGDGEALDAGDGAASDATVDAGGDAASDAAGEGGSDAARDAVASDAAGD